LHFLPGRKATKVEPAAAAFLALRQKMKQAAAIMQAKAARRFHHRGN
jgi:hypothetical protein